jgi:NADH-quinone oxidoreductase subunit F
MKILSAVDLDSVRKLGETDLYPERPKIMVGMATCGLAAGAGDIYESMRQRIEQRGLDAILTRTGCIGYCQFEPLVDVRMPGGGRVVYAQMTRPRARLLIDELARGQLPVERAWAVIDEEAALVEDQMHTFPRMPEHAAIPGMAQLPFFASQHKIVLRNCGYIDPQSIEQYIARGGYRSLQKVLSTFEPDDVISEVTRAGLRGRGGGGRRRPRRLHGPYRPGKRPA